MANKEQVYDAEISPLMAQIIDICKKHKISMFATYDIPNDEDDELCCTTFLPNESGKLSERIQRIKMTAVRVVEPLIITTQRADGSKVITATLG